MASVQLVGVCLAFTSLIVPALAMALEALLLAWATARWQRRAMA